jgi:hypothetical protein
MHKIPKVNDFLTWHRLAADVSRETLKKEPFWVQGLSVQRPIGCLRFGC